MSDEPLDECSAIGCTYHDHSSKQVETGIPELDDKLRGGIAPGDLSVVQARPPRLVIDSAPRPDDEKAYWDEIAGDLKFEECETCRAKPGTPLLCKGCIHNRLVIDRLRTKAGL